MTLRITWLPGLGLDVSWHLELVALDRYGIHLCLRKTRSFRRHPLDD